MLAQTDLVVKESGNPQQIKTKQNKTAHGHI